MLDPVQRIFLIICAVLLIAFVLRKIRKSQMQIEDSIFWFLFALSFVILALVPQIAFFVSSTLHFTSQSNMVFVYVIGILLIRELSATAKIAKLRNKVNTLTQEIALSKNQEQHSSENEEAGTYSERQDSRLPNCQNN